MSKKIGLNKETNMAKEVMIKITGSEYEVMDEEQVKQEVKGTYYQKNGKDFVVYDVVEGEENVHTTLKIEGEQFEITKSSGNSRVHMKFKQGESFPTMYHTVGGALEMEFYTTKLVIYSNADGISIQVIYEISTNQVKIGSRMIQIQIENIGS